MDKYLLYLYGSQSSLRRVRHLISTGNMELTCNLATSKQEASAPPPSPPLSTMASLLVVPVLSFAPATEPGNTSHLPHLIFAMIDDWGWYDVGFRNPLIKTPVIDQLVKEEAVLLERHYTYKFCSPTRRSFLSGRMPPHSGQDNSAGATVDLRMSTIADKLASARARSRRRKRGSSYRR